MYLFTVMKVYFTIFHRFVSRKNPTLVFCTITFKTRLCPSGYYLLAK